MADRVELVEECMAEGPCRIGRVLERLGVECIEKEWDVLKILEWNASRNAWQRGWVEDAECWTEWNALRNAGPGRIGRMLDREERVKKEWNAFRNVGPRGRGKIGQEWPACKNACKS